MKNPCVVETPGMYAVLTEEQIIIALDAKDCFEMIDGDGDMIVVNALAKIKSDEFSRNISSFIRGLGWTTSEIDEEELKEAQDFLNFIRKTNDAPKTGDDYSDLE